MIRLFLNGLWIGLFTLLVAVAPVQAETPDAALAELLKEARTACAQPS